MAAVAQAPPATAIERAVAMFGPTITLSTETVFRVAGSIQAITFFMNELACDTAIADDRNDAGYLLDGNDLLDLHEAVLAVDEMSALVAPLLPNDGEVSDDDYDDDPRVVAVDAAVDEAEKQSGSELREKFKPKLETAHLLTKLCWDMNETLVRAAA